MKITFEPETLKEDILTTVGQDEEEQQAIDDDAKEAEATGN